MKDVEAQQMSGIFHSVLHEKQLEIGGAVLEGSVVIMREGISGADLVLSFGGEGGL